MTSNINQVIENGLIEMIIRNIERLAKTSTVEQVKCYIQGAGIEMSDKEIKELVSFFTRGKPPV